MSPRPYRRRRSRDDALLHSAPASSNLRLRDIHPNNYIHRNHGRPRFADDYDTNYLDGLLDGYANSYRFSSARDARERARRYDLETFQLNFMLNIYRNKLEVLEANALVTPFAEHAELHPLMTIDGRYPTDFQFPRPLEKFLRLSNSRLEKIMLAYDLISSHSEYYSLEEPCCMFEFGLERALEYRYGKLTSLFDFLGAYQLVAYLREEGPEAFVFQPGSHTPSWLVPYISDRLSEY